MDAQLVHVLKQVQLVWLYNISTTCICVRLCRWSAFLSVSSGVLWERLRNYCPAQHGSFSTTSQRTCEDAVSLHLEAYMPNVCSLYTVCMTCPWQVRMLCCTNRMLTGMCSTCHWVNCYGMQCPYTCDSQSVCSTSLAHALQLLIQSAHHSDWLCPHHLSLFSLQLQHIRTYL